MQAGAISSIGCRPCATGGPPLRYVTGSHSARRGVGDSEQDLARHACQTIDVARTLTAIEPPDATTPMQYADDAGKPVEIRDITLCRCGSGRMSVAISNPEDFAGRCIGAADRNRGDARPGHRAARFHSGHGRDPSSQRADPSGAGTGAGDRKLPNLGQYIWQTRGSLTLTFLVALVGLTLAFPTFVFGGFVLWAAFTLVVAAALKISAFVASLTDRDAARRG